MPQPCLAYSEIKLVKPRLAKSVVASFKMEVMLVRIAETELAQSDSDMLQVAAIPSYVEK